MSIYPQIETAECVPSAPPVRCCRDRCEDDPGEVYFETAAAGAAAAAARNPSHSSSSSEWQAAAAASRRCVDPESRRYYYRKPASAAEDDTLGGFIGVCVCLFMLVLLYFALSYPTNQYYRVHYPEHTPPMYPSPNYPSSAYYTPF